MFHDVEDNFASVLFLPFVGVGKVAVLEDVVESKSGRHVVSDDFENTAGYIAFNHDDERSVVLVGNVAQ